MGPLIHEKAEARKIIFQSTFLVHKKKNYLVVVKMTTIAFVLAACLLISASVVFGHGPIPGHMEHSALYEQYKKSTNGKHCKKNLIPSTKQVLSPIGEEMMESRAKSLFHPPLPGQNGVDYHPVLKQLVTDNSTQIIYYSWHVHVYFFHEDQNVTDRTLALRDSFIKRFSLATCDDDCFMGGPFDTCTQGMCVWDPVYGVDGPHPYGQWGVYMPNNYLAETLAWFSLNHGEFSVFFHPNTGYMVGGKSHNHPNLGSPLLCS